MIYEVHEVQEESVWRHWVYRVEADSFEEAQEKAEAGEVEPEDWGSMGESEFLASGWGKDSREAADNLAGRVA